MRKELNKMEMRTETELNRNRVRGTIVFLKNIGNFGFIKNDDNDKEIFFHARGLLHSSLDDLREGSKVEYCLAVVKGREKAIAMEVIE